MRYKQHKLLEQNLIALENYMQQNNLDITPEYMIHCITEADPDQQQFKNSKWLINNLLSNRFLWEDIETGNKSKAFDTLSRFLNIRKQWPGSNLRDINQYVGLSGIAEKIRPFEIKKGMNELKREKKAKIYEDTIVLYDKDNYLVVIPKTEEASCFWGRNTEWCTASTQSTNYFDHYNEEAPLIICITPDNKKYQFHIDSPPMDENDKILKHITDPMLIQLSALTGELRNISEEYRTQELYELAVKQNGSFLQWTPDKFKTKELCEKAVRQNGWAFKYIPNELITEELCELAVKQNLHTLKYIPKEIKTQEFYKTIVQQNGDALYYIPNELITEELCELAVTQNGMALQWVPKYLKTSKICKEAVKQNGWSLKYVPDKLKTPELCNLAVQQQENNIPQEINDPKWLENKEYEVLQHHLDKFILPDNKLSVTLSYA